MYITYTIYITYIFRLSYTSHTRMHHMHYTSLCLNMNSDFAYNSRVIRLRRGIIPESYKYLGYVRTYIYMYVHIYIYIYTRKYTSRIDRFRYIHDIHHCPYTYIYIHA